MFERWMRRRLLLTAALAMAALGGAAGRALSSSCQVPFCQGSTCAWTGTCTIFECDPDSHCGWDGGNSTTYTWQLGSCSDGPDPNQPCYGGVGTYTQSACGCLWT